LVRFALLFYKEEGGGAEGAGEVERAGGAGEVEGAGEQRE